MSFLRHFSRSNLHCKGLRNLSTSALCHGHREAFKFVVVGGGAGGLSVASSLARNHPNQVAVIEPASVHYYQPMWTLVGGGLKTVADSLKPMAEVMPKNVSWIQERAVHFDPGSNFVVTDADRTLEYDFLVVALGLQLDFHKVEGLSEALGTDGVGCNYSVHTVNDTYKAIQGFKGGNAIFTLPAGPIKCLGAPQKIMYLAEEYFRHHGTRKDANVTFKSALGLLFGVEKYRNALLKICAERDINIDLFKNLIAIDSSKKEATFELVNDVNNPKATETVPYDMIHITPPMGPVEVLKSSSLVDAAGFVDVNKHTLQHKMHSNIFALGDCSNTPNSKTAAAVAAQSGVVRKNLALAVEGRSLEHEYDGYASCPLVTGHNKVVLAEFDYNGTPLETFPVNQAVERISMYHMKADVMPELYWSGLLKGYWGGPKPWRQLMHLGMSN